MPEPTEGWIEVVCSAKLTEPSECFIAEFKDAHVEFAKSFESHFVPLSIYDLAV
jgi:hypothetical protein